MNSRVTAAAHPNLALVKYWGKLDSELNIPTNSSISVNLDGALTTTSVEFIPGLEMDRISLNGNPADLDTFYRVSCHLDRVR
ncbi:MAG: diphosphomevalonate decarboxylase, partial [Anaerolineales bacterium]|nr:diphosphomevalonate decarboxylase [Anaerolineales bacterium]